MQGPPDDHRRKGESWSTGRRRAWLGRLVHAGPAWWALVLGVLDQLSGNQLDQYGIHAREVDGMPEILTAPFLHAGWDHLISNSLPFLVLGFLVLLSGLTRWLVSSLIIIIISGMTAWFLTPIHTIILVRAGSSSGSPTCWPAASGPGAQHRWQ